ncbi:universal stress protein [Sagittula sp. NFXS13]|uniref:Nucleotide-binding universal stress UspA family protein n=1 Tax=Sagittula marina TaxID=943940 RepID=A0A7W6DIW4_9RHOB|nr:universal stress protein [Sagittula marina]MBB3984081.1 nucleotide-binding universal stress UspA family protein [Sagittula marina]
MSDKFIVGFDGSEPAQRALEFATGRAAAQGGSVLIAHVLEWSPYSFLTPNELEERHARRKDEMARAESAILTPAKKQVAAAGIEVETVIRYGHIAETLSKLAKTEGATQLVLGRDGQSSFGSRVFGSVAGSLVQISPVPCTIVP